MCDWCSGVCSSDLQCAVQDWTAGDAGDADQVGCRDCCVHVHSSPNPLTLSQARHVPKGLAPLSGDFASSRRPFRATLAARGESMRLSVILPAKNEAEGLRQTLPRLREAQPEAELRSEEHTSELQSLMRTSYAVFCLKKKKHTHTT